MASTIQIKNSNSAGNSPSSLTQGELAINVNDGNLFYGDGSSVKQDFAFSNITGSNISASGDIVASSYTGDGSSLTGVGTVDTSGTPADNQISVFTDADTIEGSSKLVFVSDNSTGFSVRATNSDVGAVAIFGGIVGAANPKFGPSGSHATLRMGLDTSGDVFDFQNNKIAFDVDSTNTFIQADTDNPENLEIHADGNIELRADDNLQIFSHVDASDYNITASIVSASRIEGGVGDLIFDDVTSVTTTTPKGEIIKYGTADSAVSAGNIYFLATDGKWKKTDANSEVSSSGLLGVAISTNAADGFLVRGICDLVMAGTTPTGSTLYLSATDGRVTHTPTSASGDAIRAVGYTLSGGTGIAYFNPDSTYVVAS